VVDRAEVGAEEHLPPGSVDEGEEFSPAGGILAERFVHQATHVLKEADELPWWRPRSGVKVA
jgi:hypothetical protein